MASRPHTDSVAPTTPLAAAKMTHRITVPTARPPGSRRVQRWIASNSRSAMPEAFEQRAHEDEERHRPEYVGGRDLVDLLREHVDCGEREVEADRGEHEGHHEERERDREAQEDKEHQGREHPQGELHAHERPSTGAGPGTSRPQSTMTHLMVSTPDCISSRTKPMTKVYLNGQMMGFQADSPDSSSTR